MADGAITFHFQHPTFRLRHRKAIRAWLNLCAQTEGHTIRSLHYLFCTDDYMLEQNRQFLGHDYLTDILTFPSPSATGISGDILISIDRVRENAKTLNTSTQDETLRVMGHGVLHLIGYEDHNEAAQTTMRTKEDQWVRRWTADH